MGRQSEADRDMVSLFVPVIHDPGGFTPCYCSLCGNRLFHGCAQYAEGPVCGICDSVIQRGTFFLRDNDPRAEGGLS